MKLNGKNQLKIKLSEIPEEGLDLDYSSANGDELRGVLKELIGDHKYSIQLRIEAMGDLYKLTGKVETAMDQICSRCAIELKEPIHCEFDELLMIDDPTQYKNGSQSRSHYSSEFKENEPFCHYINSDEFDLTEFVHEIIAINEPLRPLGRPECEMSCENYDKAVAKGWITADIDAEGNEKQSPFSVLKGMKLNS